ncbi:hypothetical protein EF847_01195 [Actinobacteria bacterium YIM 96077]|uniref:Uncharacterized protein n=1 Tax=Phytoactinopolyspora halophila TaxID=1981511 RepID=A0A329R057_9ACTN|nr:hypothetical protein [Phytoactinopolyspora halophila]AYY11541.1 hypothetical protein EF847_01195 [Actinobacteria bacterium YIM 96077]RAW17975.1 hypothetical protein DPM12_03810 [Phytoactinopolyspora halophila]
MSDVQEFGEPLPSSDALTTVTRRGKLMPARRGGVLELETEEGHVELLGPFASTAELGDEVEVVGVPAPEPQTTESAPGILVQHVRKL